MITKTIKKWIQAVDPRDLVLYAYVVLYCGFCAGIIFTLITILGLTFLDILTK